ncbi:capsid maturation protease [Columbid alphaherpesvirus 1]|uniref:Capsid scaffolding protein n=1 Tax=Columbid alphaherpesvirus 1 TaxID=93386 RepID=A0A1V0M8H4_9ALPH|nr:capsid maturation protease [Columbid alphaherpesvirus 1]ARD71351.1 capsid maturation protease [Columbid alphaherpesvirus 1]
MDLQNRSTKSRPQVYDDETPSRQSDTIYTNDDLTYDDADYPAIYVAGYLALYEGDDGDELTLRREDARAALPPPAPLPINIDHRHNCTVGAVLCLVDDDLGLFFLGKINCPQFVKTLSSAASSEIFGDAEKSLSPGEKLLYLVTNYLPSVSLSSRRLQEGETPDETFFAHVALCLLGRRIGTIVNYDTSVEGAVEPFKRLSPQSKREVISAALEAETLLGDKIWQPSEGAMGRALLGTAVNNMLLRDRWRLVAERRRMAGISGHKYLQASVRTKLARDGLSGGEAEVREEAAPGGESASADPLQKRDGVPGTAIRIQSEEVKAPPGGPPRLLARPNAESAAADNSTGAVAKESGAPDARLERMSTPSGCSGPSPPGNDFLWVPMSCYNQLVAAQQQQHQHHRHAGQTAVPAGGVEEMASGMKTYQQLPPSPYFQQSSHFGMPSYVPPSTGQLTPQMPYGTFLHGPGGLGQYWSGGPPGGSLEARLMSLLEAYESERRQGPRRDGGTSDRGGWNNGRGDIDGGSGCGGRRGRKRPHDWETRADADPYYPGEPGPDRSQAPSRHPYRDGEHMDTSDAFPPARDRGGMQGDAIAGLLGAVTSLQRDVERLKGGYGGPQYASQQWPQPLQQQQMMPPQRPQDASYYGAQPYSSQPGPWKNPAGLDGAMPQMIVQRPNDQPQQAMPVDAVQSAPAVPVPQPQPGCSSHECPPSSGPSEQSHAAPPAQMPKPNNSSSAPAPTVDASAVARLQCARASVRADETADQEADMFVAQMMSHRVG